MLTAATGVAGTTDGDSTLAYTYDAAGRLLTATSGGTTVPTAVLTSTYDTVGRRQDLTATAGGQADAWRS